MMEVEDIFEQAQLSRKGRAERMPTEEDALTAMFDAYTRLNELGWSNAIYCPKDGSIFKAIEAGSTGTHDCYYDGDWPNGRWWIPEEGDIWPSRPILWKLKAPEPIEE